MLGTVRIGAKREFHTVLAVVDLKLSENYVLLPRTGAAWRR